MAIKVFVPVEGEDRTMTQDFILSDHPVFPIQDALAYCPFSRARGEVRQAVEVPAAPAAPGEASFAGS